MALAGSDRRPPEQPTAFAHDDCVGRFVEGELERPVAHGCLREARALMDQTLERFWDEGAVHDEAHALAEAPPRPEEGR